MLGGLCMCLALRRVAEALRRVGCYVDLRWVRRFSAGFMCRFGWWVLAVGGGVRSRCRCWQSPSSPRRGGADSLFYASMYSFLFSAVLGVQVIWRLGKGST